MPASLSAGEPKRLTFDGKLKLAPVFVGNREGSEPEEIVFAMHESPTLVSLHRLKWKAGGTQERLHPSVSAHQFDPAFSANGRYHAYSMSSTSPQLVLVIQDVREKREAMFRPGDGRAIARSPTFSPDGQRVAFSVSDGKIRDGGNAGYRIVSVDLRGENLKLITSSPGLNVAPAWSPDGKRIAFSSSRDGDFEIYVMDADGNHVRRLTSNPGLDTRPAWSPDNRRLAFTSNRDGDYEIYVLNIDDPAAIPQRATNRPGKDDYAQWHPDGNHLLLVSENHGDSDLYLIDAP